MNELDQWKQERWAAFRTVRGGEAFGSIAGDQDVWGHDPNDEESIHSEARQVFADLLEVAANRHHGGGRGRMLLLLGDAGSGKTHLMGAFRRIVEEAHGGCFAYAQMTTTAPDLTKYLLRNVIESLQRSRTAGSGNQWLQLSDSLVERSCIPTEELDALRNGENYENPLNNIRSRLIEDFHLIGNSNVSELGQRESIHEDFLTALLVLQRREGNATSAAMRYLRGDPMSPESLAWLCSPQGLSGAGEPAVLLKWLIGAVRDWGGVRGGAFVLCIDQLEEAYVPNAPEQGRFGELLSILRTFSETQPGFVAVLACLQDYYTVMRSLISRSYIDRLEGDTKPVYLSTKRTLHEIAALVRKRLEKLDAEAGIDRPHGADELFPFAKDELGKLQGLRPRAVLNACRDAWRSVRQNEAPCHIELLDHPPTDGAGDSTDKPLPVEWAMKWNDFKSTWNSAMPKSYSDYAEVLAWGVNALGEQTKLALQAQPAADLIHIVTPAGRAIAAICEGAAQGGRLSREIKSLQAKAVAAGHPGVAVRSTEFAKSPKAQIYGHLAELAKSGGRRLFFSEADWRAVQAWRAFDPQHKSNVDFLSWKQSNRPLAELPGLRDLVGLDDLLNSPPATGDGIVSSNETGSGGAENEKGRVPEDPATKVVPLPVELNPGVIEMGVGLGLRTKPVVFETPWFTQHLAVLGGTGSGKTTLAMTLIEHLLLRGIPAILVDRKGDLARYGDSAAIENLPGELGRLFREKVNVQLYTPGATEGRPLALSVLPSREKSGSSEEIGMQAEDAAQALGAMLRYTESRTHQKRRAALIAAIRVLLSIDDVSPTLEGLLDLMSSGDPALMQAMDYLNPKLLHDIVEDLDSFRKINERMLSAGSEPLDAARMLGLGQHATPGRTRLSVISTKFLNDDLSVQFWVAQLMMELARFASRQPSPKLQAVVMLDEADLYLPAIGKPASKPPVENALRRFRSYGIGLILATQSPGDLDYRCRENIQTWLVGRVKENRALEKLKPVFGDAGRAALEKLGQHPTGEFCLVRAGELTTFQADRNLLPTEQMSDTEILAAARNSRNL